MIEIQICFYSCVLFFIFKINSKIQNIYVYFFTRHALHNVTFLKTNNVAHLRGSNM